MKLTIYRTTRTEDKTMGKGAKKREDHMYMGPLWEIELETMQDLVDLWKEVDEELVITRIQGEPAIEIYDTYRE